MRVIIAVDARPLLTRQIGGTEQYARNVVAQWAAMDLPHEFIFLVDKVQRSGADYDASFLEGLGLRGSLVPVGGFHLNLGSYLTPRVFSALSRILAHYKVDLYYSFTPLVPRVTGCPVVQTIHDLAFELDASVRHRPGSRALRRQARWGATRADRIIAVSNQTKSDISSLYDVSAERIAVVYNGINPVFVPESDGALRGEVRGRYGLEGSYILAVGSDIPRRNYGRMFQAMQVVWQSDSRIKLAVAGRSAWSGSPLYERARAAQALERLVLVEAPADALLAELYRNAVMTCCASSFEGFGMSVLESMACGTPVACSDMRSLREVADDAAVYFPHDDAEFMGTSMLGLLEDVEYRRQLKYRGLARAALFTWQTAARLILDTLEAVGKG